MYIAFIGFGEAGRALTDTLLARNPKLRIAAFDHLDTPEMARAMTARGLRRYGGPVETIAGVDWVISAVSADQSLVAARSVADHLEPGQVFIDMNSVSPGRKAATARLVEARGARYLDMAVMGPVHPLGHATPVLLAGSHAKEIWPELEAEGFAGEVVGEKPGEATAIKMVRSVFVKGLEAITVECALAAAASGVQESVFASLAKSYPQFDWDKHLARSFERMLRHGTRRAAEMRESASTLDDLGLLGALPAQIAEAQARLGALPLTDLPDGPLPAGITEVARLRGARPPE